MKSTITFAVGLCLISSSARAEDGPWTGHDWYNADIHLGVKNGVLYSNAGDIQRRLDSTRVLVGD